MTTLKEAGLLQGAPPSFWHWHWVAHPHKKTTMQFWWEIWYGCFWNETDGLGFLQILEPRARNRRAAQTKTKITKNSQTWARGSMLPCLSTLALPEFTWVFTYFYHPSICCDEEFLQITAGTRASGLFLMTSRHGGMGNMRMFPHVSISVRPGSKVLYQWDVKGKSL